MLHKSKKKVRYFFRCPHCGGDAFEFRKKPEAGMLMSTGNVIHSGNPKPGDPITCQECGEGIPVWDLKERNMVERADA